MAEGAKDKIVGQKPPVYLSLTACCYKLALGEPLQLVRIGEGEDIEKLGNHQIAMSQARGLAISKATDWELQTARFSSKV